MSGIFFRVYENLLAGENDRDRFKMEIKVNKGSTLKPEKMDLIDDHCIQIELENSYVRTMTLDDVDSFFRRIFVSQ